MLRPRMIFGFTSAAVAAVVALLPGTSHALVDMKNSNYSEQFVDINMSGTGYALRVTRAYNSRSVFTGIFGFGWCSDFETTLERLPEGRLKLTECGAGQETFYTPTKFDPKAMDKLTDSIIAHYKKKNPNASSSTIDNLRIQVRGNDEVRAKWADDMGYKAPNAEKGVVYIADNLNVEQMTYDGSQYTRVLSDGTSQRFDSTGKLAALYDKNGNFLKLTYNAGLLREVIDSSGKKLTFTMYPNRRVKEIVAPSGIRAEYKYKGEDLVEVKNMWKNSYTFQYDDNHNLTRINFPDKTFKALTYNQQRDWVLSFQDRAQNGVSCLESYKYEEDKENPKDHFWSIATKKCGNEVVNESRFEFWHKTLANGTKVLERALTRSSTDSVDVTYHPEFGRPLTIKKNGVTTAFEYFGNGLVKSKTTATSKMVFEYKNTFNKVSKVNADFFDDKGKVTKKRETLFQYDPKSNLVAAQNTDGQSVKLTYDVRGRIETIADQAKKEVRISYDEKTGKPATISRPKVGSIVVKYKPNGEIQKVESSDGPTVAVQIASTFNNLLDIIAPATSELSL